MKRLMTGFVLLTAGAVFAGPNADRPDARHAWAVHDDNRPNAPVVEVGARGIPSDATVLFDGTQKSIDEHWCDKDGKPTQWKERDGLLVCVPRSGSAYAKDQMGDCQVHLEFMIPDPSGPGLGNSGVYLLGKYEIQILDSVNGKTELRYPHAPWKNANYADGQMGAIYGQTPPLANPARLPGQLQVFDVIFHPALWQGDTLVEPATITAFLNGVLIQDNWKLEGPTYYCRRTAHDKANEPEKGPVVSLQDHGNPVPYRLIWARPIPSRRANTVHGGDYFNAADAAKLRGELARKTLRLAHETDKPEAKLVWLWESWCYEKNAQVMAEIEAYTPEYIKRVEGFAAGAGDAVKTELSNMKGFCAMGARNGLFAADCPLAQAVAAAMKRLSSKERKF